jgi:DNA-directed RNA polymerase specialized sigma24 family protein
MGAPTPLRSIYRQNPTPRPTAPRKPNSRRASRRWSAVWPSYRTAITLTSLQGVTQGDAARPAGISISGMKSRVQRA